MRTTERTHIAQNRALVLTALVWLGLGTYPLAVAQVRKDPASTPHNGLIAFNQFDDLGRPHIIVVEPDGSGFQQFPDPSQSCFQCAESPAWTPDGSRIFFDSDAAGNIHIFSENTDGSDLKQVTFGANFEGFPSIAPDGASMAYDGPGGINVSNIDDTGAHNITFGPAGGWDSLPDFSPDGKRIAFWRVPHGNCPRRPFACRNFISAIFVVNADGTGLHRITDWGRNWAGPKWSADGSKILLHTYDDRGTLNGISADLWVVNPDGKGLQPLTRTREGSFSFGADWSPDGTKIVFANYQFPDDHTDLKIMNADGTGVTTLINCGACNLANWGTHP